MTSKIRDNRQAEILDAALSEIHANGVASLTMSRLGQLTGMSRPAIYQYFSSREHVLAELLINDLADLVNEIDSHVSAATEPIEQIRVWINYSLLHLVSGEHSIIREISEASLPLDLRGMVRALHGQFMLGLMSPVRELGIASVESACHFVYSAVQSATKRIESGSNFAAEVHAVQSFVVPGLLGMKKGQPDN
jgi:AcrR family transcriptional regulator